MLQQARTDITTAFYRKKQIDVRFLCVCLSYADTEFCHNIVKAIRLPRRIHSYFAMLRKIHDQ